jgi:hypothetical protein
LKKDEWVFSWWGGAYTHLLYLDPKSTLILWDDVPMPQTQPARELFGCILIADSRHEVLSLSLSQTPACAEAPACAKASAGRSVGRRANHNVCRRAENLTPDFKRTLQGRGALA